MNITKFINEAGCDLAAGWDGAHLDGQHSTGHPMRITVTRSMRDPRFVRYSATVDGSQHIDGSIDSVGRDELQEVLPNIWKDCFDAPSKYRDPLPVLN